MSPVRSSLLLLLLLLPQGGLSVLSPAGAAAQVVSPGRLTDAHAHLEGIRSCAECHELGRRGADRDRCLACHEPLARRIAGGGGYHARLREDDCAACHREHLGRDAPLVRLDTAAFLHEQAGYELRGAHAPLDCASCHRPELVRAADVRAYRDTPEFLARTFLGLPTACAGCHRGESPHGAQFEARACTDCHGEERWDGAERFDHALAAFRLTGRHRDVACAECHPANDLAEARYEAVDHASCAACHADPHRGAMAGDCRSCHTPEGWERVRTGAIEGRFDHDRTGFALTGRHAGLECAACHRGRAGESVRIRFRPGTEGRLYPRPVAGSCAACHLDPHRGELADRCEACHRDGGWSPTSYGLDRHARSAFPLESAHAAVPCDACHRDPDGAAGAPSLRFRLETTCRACHAADDPHAGLYDDRPCESCHRPTRFADAVLDHATVADVACRSCHQPDDPHGAQFAGEPCDACHAVSTFRIARFDHDRTGFPLGGAHADAACAACHPAEPGDAGTVVVRYRPISSSCRDCHGGAG
jgi:hypothetical protein